MTETPPPIPKPRTMTPQKNEEPDAKVDNDSPVLENSVMEVVRRKIFQSASKEGFKTPLGTPAMTPGNHQICKTCKDVTYFFIFSCTLNLIQRSPVQATECQQHTELLESDDGLEAEVVPEKTGHKIVPRSCSIPTAQGRA